MSNLTMANPNSNYNSIDVAKYIASIFIFTMHCNAFEDYGSCSLIFEMLSRWGVPFYFISTSYFLFKKVNTSNETSTIKKYCFRIFSLYSLWFIYNLPSFIYLRFISKSSELISISAYLKLFLGFILSSTFIGSWYLASCIFSSIFIYCLSKRFSNKSILLISSILYVLCVASSVYGGLLSNTFNRLLSFLCFPLNLFCGCFYFAIGKYISENESKVLSLFSRKKAICLFCLFYCLYILEVLIAKKFAYLRSTDIGAFTVIIGFLLFVYCLQSECKISNSKQLRKLSTIVYCCQGNILCAKGAFKLYINNSSLVCYLFSVVILICIIVLVLLVQKKKWAWTYYLT